MRFSIYLLLMLLFCSTFVTAHPPLRDVLSPTHQTVVKQELQQNRCFKRLRKKLTKCKNPLLIGLGIIGLLLLLKSKSKQRDRPQKQRPPKKKGKVLLYILLGILTYYVLAFLLLINGVALLPLVFF